MALLSKKHAAFYGSTNGPIGLTLDEDNTRSFASSARAELKDEAGVSRNWSDLTRDGSKQHKGGKPLITATVTRPTPILSWQKLSVKIADKDKKVMSLLQNVSGVLLAGEIVAILGPSGAGKTTLLDSILGMQPRQAVRTGTVRCWSVDADLVREIRPGYEGVIRDIDANVRNIGYISQHDIFHEMLTVEEHLQYQVLLRRPDITNISAADGIIRGILEDLSLVPCSTSLIANISGGERRRVSVATELISDPAFLLCDEITTGLDMYQALQLVRCLKALKKTGVLCSIHQPPTQVYSLFTRSMFMVGGRLVSEGSPSQVLKHFKDVGYECPATSNPADFVIQILSAGSISDVPYQRFLQNVENVYENSASKNITNFLIEIQAKTMNRSKVEGKLKKLSVWKEWELLVKRSLKYTSRDKVYKRIRVVQVVFISTILGLLYLKTEPTNVQNIMGSLFFLLINISFSGLFATLQTFPNELPIFRREYKGKVVRVGPYYMAKTLSEVPFYLIYPTLYVVIAFFLVGYSVSTEKFFMYWFLMLLSYHTSLSLGYLISAATPSAEAANAIGLPIGVTIFLFAGYFITVPTIPKALRWLVYLSYMFYGFQGVVYNEFNNVVFSNCTFNCSDWISGQQVLRNYGFDGKSVLTTDILVLLLMMVLLRLCGYFVLKRTA